MLHRTKRFTLWALLGICLTGAFFRIHDFRNTPPGLYPDEAMNGNNALEAIATGSYKIFYPENNGREGLFINIQALFLNALGRREAWVLRLPSALFGILTITGVYFLARELFSQAVGLLAAFFIAVAHWHVIFSRIGLRVITAPFFIVWGLVFLFMGFRKLRRARSFSHARAYFLVAGLFYGLGFHGYIAYRSTPFILLPVLLYFIYRFRRSGLSREIRLGVATFIVTTVVVVVPLALYFAAHPDSFFGRASGLSVFNSDAPVKNLLSNAVKTVGMLNWQGDLNWRHNVSGKPELFWPVGLLFWAGVLLGLSSLAKRFARNRATFVLTRQSFAYVMLFIWIIVAAVPVILSNEGVPHALRSLLLVPPITILAAVATVRAAGVVERRVGKQLTVIVMASFILYALVDGYHTCFVLWAKDPHLSAFFGADYVKTGKEINALPDETQKFVVVEARGMTVHGVPMPAQTVMFLTDTYSGENREKKNLSYISSREAKEVPPGSYTWTLKDIPSEP